MSVESYIRNADKLIFLRISHKLFPFLYGTATTLTAQIKWFFLLNLS